MSRPCLLFTVLVLAGCAGQHGASNETSSDRGMQVVWREGIGCVVEDRTSGTLEVRVPKEKIGDGMRVWMAMKTPGRRGPDDWKDLLAGRAFAERCEPRTERELRGGRR